MSKRLRLELEIDDQTTNEETLTINKSYADRYDKWRRLEEMQKLKDKYGNDAEESSEDESSSEEEEVDWTAENERQFLSALSALKSRDPKIYTEERFFSSEPIRSVLVQRESKEEITPMYLKDYERKLILEKGGDISDEEVKDAEDVGYYQQQQQKNKQEFVKALAAIDTDDDQPLLIKREKTTAEKEKEDEQYYEWLKGESKNDESFRDLKGLRDVWNSEDIAGDEKFLRDYFVNKQYETNNMDVGIPTYDEITELDKEEEEFERERDFERKYNFRFEEPDSDFISQYPRTIKSSIRNKDDRRKLKRTAVRERKREEKENKKKEIRRLKTLKKREIEDKMAKLRSLAGDDTLPLKIEDLEDDFDPVEYDKRMKELFDNEYYEGEEDEEKPVFPKDSDESDESDYDNFETNNPSSSSCDKIINDNKVEEKEVLYREKPASRRKRKRNSKFAEAVLKKKPRFDPGEKTFEEYFNEYYALNYEDIIGDNLITRFKYRTVEPNSYGLTTDEILKADDRQLNAWASLKKVTAYKSKTEDRYDVQAYEKKARDIEKKKRILTADYGGKKSLKLMSNEDGVGVSESAKRKRPRRKKTKVRKSAKEQLKDERAANKLQLDSKFSQNIDGRLLAYGVNPKKFKNKLLYGKKNVESNEN